MNVSPSYSPKIYAVHSAQVDFVTLAASVTGFAVLLVDISATWSIHAHIFSASICRPATQQFQ
jgi:hypothetical protein